LRRRLWRPTAKISPHCGFQFTHGLIHRGGELTEEGLQTGWTSFRRGRLRLSWLRCRRSSTRYGLRYRRRSPCRRRAHRPRPRHLNRPRDSFGTITGILTKKRVRSHRGHLDLRTWGRGIHVENGCRCRGLAVTAVRHGRRTPGCELEGDSVADVDGNEGGGVTGGRDDDGDGGSEGQAG